MHGHTVELWKDTVLLDPDRSTFRTQGQISEQISGGVMYPSQFSACSRAALIEMGDWTSNYSPTNLL